MRKLNVTIILGVLVAVIGAAIVIAYGRGVQNKVADGKATVPVVVVTQDVPAGTPVTSLGTVTKISQVPKAYVATGALRTLQDAPAGATLLAPLTTGTQLSKAVFGTAGQAAASALRPAAGTVALAVQVGLTPGVARYVGPGSTVDMFLTYAAKGAPGAASGPMTKLFASGVKVLSVSAAAPITPVAGQPAQAAPTVAPDNVLAVLQADPELAQRIVSAVQTGQIYLALDAAGDGAHATSAGVTPESVLGLGQ